MVHAVSFTHSCSFISWGYFPSGLFISVRKFTYSFLLVIFVLAIHCLDQFPCQVNERGWSPHGWHLILPHSPGIHMFSGSPVGNAIDCEVRLTTDHVDLSTIPNCYLKLCISCSAFQLEQGQFNIVSSFWPQDEDWIDDAGLTYFTLALIVLNVWAH